MSFADIIKNRDRKKYKYHLMYNYLGPEEVANSIDYLQDVHASEEPVYRKRISRIPVFGKKLIKPKYADINGMEDDIITNGFWNKIISSNGKNSAAMRNWLKSIHHHHIPCELHSEFAAIWGNTTRENCHYYCELNDNKKSGAVVLVFLVDCLVDIHLSKNDPSETTQIEIRAGDLLSIEDGVVFDVDYLSACGWIMVFNVIYSAIPASKNGILHYW